MRKINEGKLAIIMVLALIAFVAGSAVGITVSINEHEVVNDTNNTSHVENVTVEMLNKPKVNETIYYEENYTSNFTNESSFGQNMSNLQQNDSNLQQYEYV